MSTYSILSIQVGKPKNYVEKNLRDGEDQSWTSGIYKSPVQGKVWVGKINLDGDGQADLVNHGGADRPILAYGAAHYPVWQAEVGREFPFGSFGENFTVDGLTEETVCIGDVFRIGDVVVEVSQPRRPCFKLARRNEISDLAATVLRTGRTGWYMRVLEEGYVEAGMELELVKRVYPEWTIANAHAAMSGRKSNSEYARELGLCPALSQDWKRMLLK